MNNNNIYFSCFSLIRACVSSLFDNFSKVVCGCLIVCFVFVSPAAAYASTTESMMKFAMLEDEYSVMPLSVESNFDFKVSSGSYNLTSDSFSGSSYTFSDLNNGDMLTPAYKGVSSNYLFSTSLRPYFGFSVGSPSSSSTISIPNNSTVRFLVNGLYLTYSLDDHEYYLPHDKAVPFKVYAKMYFTATQVYGNTHSPTSFEQVVSLGNCFVPSDYHSSQWNVDAVIPVSADTSSSTADSLYNINVRNIELFVVFDWSSLYRLSDGNYISLVSEGTLGNRGFANIYINGSAASNINAPRIFLTYETSGGNSYESSLSASTSVIQNNINAVNTNLSNKISAVSTQITQTTNTITTKIDTMANDVKTGLQNVVTSAQQNTQNIINTVTQKVDQVKTGITEVKDSILDLPNKLQEMLTEFIVPDAETMGGKYSEFTELLESKLGVIYQIPAMILELFETLVSGVTDPQTTLTFPSLSLPWIDGTQMKLWDSIEFEIIPTGMDVLKELIQTVTSMVCVIMTFNSVKRIYENFLRGR